MKSIRTATLTALVCAAAATAGAQTAGVRVGISGSPSQFYTGVHYESAPLVDQLHFRPNLEVGVGDDQTLVAFNFEFAYYVPMGQGRRSSPWDLYIGAGPALVIDHVTNDTNAGGGFNIVVGAQQRHGLFTELKVGFADSPNFKFGVGYTFGR